MANEHRTVEKVELPTGMGFGYGKLGGYVLTFMGKEYKVEMGYRGINLTVIVKHHPNGHLYFILDTWVGKKLTEYNGIFDGVEDWVQSQRPEREVIAEQQIKESGKRDFLYSEQDIIVSYVKGELKPDDVFEYRIGDEKIKVHFHTPEFYDTASLIKSTYKKDPTENEFDEFDETFVHTFELGDTFGTEKYLRYIPKVN